MNRKCAHGDGAFALTVCQRVSGKIERIAQPMAALTQHVCGWLSPGAARRVKRTPTRGLAPVTAAAVGAGASAAPAGTPSHTRRDVLAAAVALAAFAPAAARAEEGTVLGEVCHRPQQPPSMPPLCCL